MLRVRDAYLEPFTGLGSRAELLRWVDLARSTVEGVDGVSVTLARDGKLTTSHATDDLVRELDGVQYQDGDGPCVEATRSGRVVAMDAGPFWDPEVDWVSDEWGSHHLYWTGPPG